MSGREPSVTEETGATPVAADATGGADTKASERDFLRTARRDLTADEASSAAGVRWLQYDLERLEKERSMLQKTVDQLRTKNETLSIQFHDQRVSIETLRGSATLSKKNEVLADLCLGCGSAGIGAATGFTFVPAVADFATVVLIISGILLVGGIALRMWK